MLLKRPCKSRKTLRKTKEVASRTTTLMMISMTTGRKPRVEASRAWPRESKSSQVRRMMSCSQSALSLGLAMDPH